MKCTFVQVDARTLRVVLLSLSLQLVTKKSPQKGDPSPIIILRMLLSPAHIPKQVNAHMWAIVRRHAHSPICPDIHVHTRTQECGDLTWSGRSSRQGRASIPAPSITTCLICSLCATLPRACPRQALRMAWSKYRVRRVKMPRRRGRPGSAGGRSYCTRSHD